MGQMAGGHQAHGGLGHAPPSQNIFKLNASNSGVVLEPTENELTGINSME